MGMTTLHNDKLVIMKKFNLPSVFIQIGNLESCQMSCIRQEGKVSILL